LNGFGGDVKGHLLTPSIHQKNQTLIVKSTLENYGILGKNVV
jgi:hypothetical protein